MEEQEKQQLLQNFRTELAYTKNLLEEPERKKAAFIQKIQDITGYNEAIDEAFANEIFGNADEIARLKRQITRIEAGIKFIEEHTGRKLYRQEIVYTMMLVS